MSEKPDYDQLYEIAEEQAGYFTAQQAGEVGVSAERLSANTSRGRFARVAQGIYRFRHFPGSPYEDLFVAWLRAGPAAVIGYESALAVYELSDVLPNEVHLIVPRNSSRRRPGIRQHTTRLQADEITQRYGLPVTTIERTVCDLVTSGLAEEFIYQAIQEALKRGLTSREKLLQQSKRASRTAARMIERIVDVNHEIQ